LADLSSHWRRVGSCWYRVRHNLVLKDRLAWWLKIQQILFQQNWKSV
jgi:hypothetical protein